MKYLVLLLVIIVLGAGAFYLQNKDNASLFNQASPKMHEQMGHMDHAASVSDDKSFIEGMIPHHREAVTSSQELLKVAKDPQVRKLAENIIVAQEREITQMKDWYKEWYGQDYKDNGKYKPMMRSTLGKSSEEAEQMYLHDMMMHHQAAIAMAKAVLPITKHEEIKTLGSNIVTTQNEEINLMRKLLMEDTSGHMMR